MPRRRNTSVTINWEEKYNMEVARNSVAKYNHERQIAEMHKRMDVLIDLLDRQQREHQYGLPSHG